MSYQTTHCPFCGEEILTIARKCKHCGEWLDRVAQPGKTTIITAFSSEYEILEEIGRGGMSTVYKARHKRLGRIVALKIVPRELSHDREFVKRLRHEAIATSKLNHPNIITIFDVGEQEGFPYISMEYLEGGTLSDLLQTEGHLSEEKIKEIIVPILKGLDYAHSKGIIHRDIKSSNIMFASDGRPVLMDFGIAKSAEGTKLTKTGSIIGTPEYMSPEQERGVDDIDGRTDIYSIGVVMYEMAAGRVPFQSSTALSVLHKLLHEELQPPSAFASGISEDFSLVITQALRKDRNERYQGCKEYIDSINKGKPTFETHSKKPTKTKTQKLSKVNKPSIQKKDKNSGIILKISIAIISVLILVILGYFSMTHFQGKVEIPDVVGMQYSDALELLKDNDLRGEKGEVLQTKTEITEKIADQHPRVGTQVKKNTKIILDIYHKLIDVPEVKYKDKKEAKQILNNYTILVKDAEYQFHPNIATGKVIGILHDPQELPEGDKVTLIISNGIEMIDLPDLSGKTLDFATDELLKLGFFVGEINSIKSLYNKGEIVVTTIPQSGIYAKGSIIDINVSKEMIEVPELIGLSYKEAKKQLEWAGLQIGKKTYVDSDIDESDMIVRHSPLKGRVSKGTKVDIELSVGNSVVPNLIGLDTQEARYKLTAGGLSIGSVNEIVTDKIEEDGKVIKQSKEAGTKTSKDKRVDVITGIYMLENMVLIQSGTFQMGSNNGVSNEKPVHSVWIDDFYIGKYEVTQKEWKEVVGNNPSRFKGDNLPVEKVSWYDAVEFCNIKSRKEGLTPCYSGSGKNITCNFRANGYRLPTEAEWGYAARGGNKSGDYTYSGSNTIGNVAWYDGNSANMTHPAGKKQLNELGLYDMSGNVCEWCNDWYDSDYYSSSPRNNPGGPSSGRYRVMRGGGWIRYSNDFRVADRNYSSPNYGYAAYGFRYVRTFLK